MTEISPAMEVALLLQQLHHRATLETRGLWRGFKVRLETLAQVGPHSRRKSLAPGGGIFKKQKKDHQLAVFKF